MIGVEITRTSCGGDWIRTALLAGPSRMAGMTPVTAGKGCVITPGAGAGMPHATVVRGWGWFGGWGGAPRDCGDTTSTLAYISIVLPFPQM